MEAALSPSRRPSLVLIGFMGAGKSTAARELASATGTDPLDTDALLEERLGMSIASFFEQRGEAEFRSEEERVVLEALARADGAPVALGGGAVSSPRVREALRAHRVVLLDISESAARRRVSGDTRPLARDPERFAALHAERTPTYESLADVFVPAEGAATLPFALDWIGALDDAPAGTRLLFARVEGRAAYPVYVGRGLLGSDLWPLSGRRFCVSDGRVAGLYADAVEPLAARITVMPGEQAKTIAHAEIVWTELVRAGMTRDDHVVALGGGVVGDLAGFCAATYQRGVPVVQVPTTVVAQVDSAYGGKTGVDLAEAKNYVGAYHQPAAVLVDPVTLETLPAQERAAGYAEVVKTALIAGRPLWDRVRSGAPVEDDVILGCARTKLAIVADDERDAGGRQALNLGHTVAHAIETATGYARYRHGEAVALGLLAALRLSGQEGLREEVSDLLADAGLPTRLVDAELDDVIAAVSRDKKRRGGEVRFVLLDGPGEVRTGAPVAEADLRAAVSELMDGSA